VAISFHEKSTERPSLTQTNLQSFVVVEPLQKELQHGLTICVKRDLLWTSLYLPLTAFRLKVNQISIKSDTMSTNTPTSTTKQSSIESQMYGKAVLDSLHPRGKEEARNCADRLTAAKEQGESTEVIHKLERELIGWAGMTVDSVEQAPASPSTTSRNTLVPPTTKSTTRPSTAGHPSSMGPPHGRIWTPPAGNQ
jgi:hypothetical protein